MTCPILLLKQNRDHLFTTAQAIEFVFGTITFRYRPDIMDSSILIYSIGISDHFQKKQEQPLSQYLYKNKHFPEITVSLHWTTQEVKLPFFTLNVNRTSAATSEMEWLFFFCWRLTRGKHPINHVY